MILDSQEYRTSRRRHHHHHAVGRDATKTVSIHLTIALHYLSLCCESDVLESVDVSQLQVSLDGTLEPQPRANSLSVTRRQLRIENLLW